MSSFNKLNVTIRDVEVVSMNLTGKNVTVVKVLTSEPELHGLGCATFAFRNKAIELYVKEYLAPLLIGRNVDDIEDLWHLMNNNGYWRNGPIANNAISGVDMALWDIKGKLAGLPVYSLLGGKSRQGIPIYRHCDAKTVSEVFENIDRFQAEGVNHFRIQVGVYGGTPRELNIPPNSKPGDYFCAHQYMDDTLQLFEDTRSKYGYGIELIHDSHERLTPIQAIDFAKRMEKYRLFYLEDILSPEQGEWYKTLRTQVSTPIAVGELFNNPKEYDYLITNRLLDYVRIHISQIGGITPARKVAIFAEQYAIRTAWHGPGDVSPVGHAANVHLGIASHNTGVQEVTKQALPPLIYEAFPGSPEVKNGYIYASEKPGLGIEMNMDVVKKYPATNDITTWTQTRHTDGTICTP